MSHTIRWFTRSALLVGSTLLLSSSTSCTCAHQTDPQQPSDPEGEHEWSIHVFAGSGSERKKFDFGPVRVPHAVRVGRAVSALGTKTVVNTLDGGVNLEGDDTFDTAGSVQAWGLLGGAMAQCGVQAVQLPPWGMTPSWFAFTNTPQSCDETLKFEETLLCAADKLKEVADAVGTVQWASNGVVLPSPLPALPWTIPPQAAKDRFIARDLAIHVLAHIARLDARPIDGPTCGEEYAHAVLDPAYGLARSTQIFNATPPAAPYWPSHGVGLSPATVQTLAAEHVAFEGHVLRAAGRMLHDLVRESVYADLAGAEQRRAHATDPLRANLISWGFTGAQNGAYNALPHVAKILTGRLELGTNVPDPACGGASSMDALVQLYGDEIAARALDVPVRTASQQNAARIVASTGIVLPYASATPLAGTVIKSFLKSQLTETLAKRNYGTPTSPLGQAQTAIESMVDSLPDQDLRFALNRNWVSYALATDDGSGMVMPSPQLKEADYASPAVPAGSIVANNGLDRERMARDVMARLAGVFANTQCNELHGDPVALSPSHPPPGDPLDWPFPDEERRYRLAEMQDVFSLGQAFHGRIALMFSHLNDPTLWWVVPPDAYNVVSDALRVAMGAKAELWAWAGPGRVNLRLPDSAVLPPELMPAVLEVELGGFRGTKDLGFDASEQEEFRKNLMLVYGPPWVAECAAGIRGGDCPENFEADYASTMPTVLEFRYDDPMEGHVTGHDGVFIRLSFATTGHPQFNPSPDTLYNKNHLYLVSRVDPARPGKNGVVLATLSLRSDPDGKPLSTSAPVSAMQRELINAALGHHTDKDRAAVIDAPMSSVGPDYCIPGVSRDIFVPLENELTSDGDQYENSWKHYLNLAKQAAERADALGEKLITFGTQKELRREEAGSNLAEYCGDETALDNVSVSDKGEITTTGDHEVLDVCLNETKIDIVFLSTRPATVSTASAAEAYARSKICGGVPSTAWQPSHAYSLGDQAWNAGSLYTCTKAGISAGSGGPSTKGSDIVDNTAHWSYLSSPHPICSKPTFTVGFLGLVDPPTPPAAPGSMCAKALDAAHSLRTGFRSGQLANSLQESYGDPFTLVSTAQMLRLQNNVDGEWTVNAGGLALMSSAADSKLWPGCLRTTAAEKCDWSKPEVVAFNNLFRTCAAEATLRPKGSPLDVPSELALGSCGVATTDAQELQLIRWRVEGALWFLAASTGKVPGGLIKAQIPVADKSVTAAWGPSEEPYVFTAYSPSKSLQNIGGSYLLNEPGLAAGDVGQVKPIYDISYTRFLSFAVGSDSDPSNLNELPTWMLAAYGSGFAGKYKHLPVGNAPLETNFEHIGMLFGSKGLPITSPGAAQPDARTIWTSLATGVEGLKCGSSSGAPPLFGVPSGRSAATWSDWDIISSVGALKMNVNTRVVQDTVASYGLIFDGDQLTRALRWIDGSDGEKAKPFAALPASLPLCRTIPLDWQSHTFHYPHDYSPAERVPMFVNSLAPCTSCAAASTLVEAAGLACIATNFAGEPSPKAPPVTSPQDLPLLGDWIQALGRNMDAQFAAGFLEQLPESLVHDFEAKKASSGKKGLHGGKSEDIAVLLETLRDSWRAATKAITEAGSAINMAHTQIEGTKLKEEQANIDIAMKEWAVYSQMAEVAAKAASVTDEVTSFGGLGAASAGALASLTGELLQLKSLRHVDEAISDNEVRTVLLGLNDKEYEHWNTVDEQLGNARKAINLINKGTEELGLLEAKARRAAAIASGVDFYRTADGKVVTMPVNSVLRRQYDGTQQRYDAALREAKYLAFIARRAIEQRLGVPLSAMTSPVGPLDAPQVWADDICRLTGVDYKKLSSAAGLPDAGPDAETDAELVKDYVDAWVGDYVTKLGNLVDYYNIDYPSHDGDDTAVLSLKEDLLPPSGVCLVEATNVLYYSGNLDTNVPSRATDPAKPEHRWQKHPCESPDAKCLQAYPQQSLVVPSDPPAEAAGSSVTWLVDYIPTSTAPATTPIPGEPANMLSQEVHLGPGTYILSWWDQARTSTGALATSATEDYRVEVSSGSWTRLAMYTGLPWVSAVAFGDAGPDASEVGGPELWSPRRSLTFTVKEAGTYHVAFGASVIGGGLGSVAIANVQLEQAPPGGSPTAYVATDSSRQVVSTSCKKRTSEQFRAMFRRVCDGPTCWYELIPNLIIDTNKLTEPGAPLAGKIARGNFNFRHVTVALNLVGTGVRSCEGGATSCYGSGFLEYTLRHDATRAGILDWDGTSRVFNFGIAPIEHGKALAAERYITLPIGSADQSLLSQPSILKNEYRGRPLDGIYSLKVWEDPSLRWNRLEDIQLIFTYRYWSRINKNTKTE